MFAVVALLATGTALPGQAPSIQFELRPFVGASIPTGSQRDFFRDEPLIGFQAAVELNPTLHMVGSLGGVPSDARYAVSDGEVNVFQYDVGLELGWARPLTRGWEFRPFFGFGAGGRTYAYTADVLDDQTCLSGYGALGSEFRFGRTGVRLEARDNVFSYRSPIARVRSKTRNDVDLMLGFAYHFR
jgi:hypothetical protein